jgi:5,5'-dehydrodivanillate O-demethylase oxygenase subunit
MGARAAVEEDRSMKSAETNARWTQVGPGTPCGELLRRYWIPIGPFAQLLENPVRRVRFLGEDLVLFRDTREGLGLIGDRCLHRRVDLQYGIPDERGLRCPYHGWLFGANGKCLERPLEAAPEREIAQSLKSYPVEELGGMLFAYMGPLPAPALPRWDLFVWPNCIRQIAVNVLGCNWWQCHENNGDPTHSVWLHGRMFEYVFEQTGQRARAANDAHTSVPRRKMGIGLKEVRAERTQYGMHKSVVYAKELGAEEDWASEHGPSIFPFTTQTGVAGASRSEYQIRVPIDDTHTMHLCYQTYGAPAGVEVPHQDVVPWYEPPRFDERGRPILDYILAQDMLMWEAQGEIVDRTQEVLGRTDVPIDLMRRILDEQIELVAAGKTPMNVFAESPPMLHARDPGQADRHLNVIGNFRTAYHKGLGTDDVDRYGPAFDLVCDLHRRTEEAMQGTLLVK